MKKMISIGILLAAVVMISVPTKVKADEIPIFSVTQNLCYGYPVTANTQFMAYNPAIVQGYTPVNYPYCNNNVYTYYPGGYTTATPYGSVIYNAAAYTSLLAQNRAVIKQAETNANNAQAIANATLTRLKDAQTAYVSMQQQAAANPALMSQVYELSAALNALQTTYNQQMLDANNKTNLYYNYLTMMPH